MHLHSVGRTLLGAAFLLLTPVSLFAQHLTWARAWSDTSYVAAVAAAPDGESYAAGERAEGGGFVTRLDRHGNRIWFRALTRDPVPPGSSRITVRDAAATPDGVVIVGRAVPGEPYLILGWVQAYDAFGNVKWTHQFRDNDPTGIAADSDGNVYVSGAIGGAQKGSLGSDALLVKYDGAGTVAWTRRFGDPLFADALYDVAAGSDGRIYVVGYFSVGGHGTPVTRVSFVSAYDLDGNLLWTRPNDEFFTRTAAASGTVYVANGTSIRRYSAAGDELWTRDPLTSGLTAVAADAQGNPFVGGSVNDAVFVEALDQDGVSRWRLEFGDPHPNLPPVILSLDVNTDAEVFAGGHSLSHETTVGGFVAKIGAEDPTIEVTIDVRPGSATNPVNLSSGGLIPVAIATTPDFDASTVAASSVCFGDAEQGAERDCTEAHGIGHLEDVDRDGDLDLVLHYETNQTGIDPGGAAACLTGDTSTGVAIIGCDTVTVLGARARISAP